MKDVSAEIAAVAAAYQYHPPPEALVRTQELVARLQRLLLDWLGSFHISVPALAEAKTVSQVMQLLLHLAGALGALAVIWLVWTRLSQLRLQSALARNGQVTVTGVPDSAAWRREAERLSGAGDWRAGCRALYLSALRLLEEAGIAGFVPTRTNYEYWYALSGRPGVQKAFRELVAPVETVWFGRDSATADDYRLCLARLTDLEAQVEPARAQDDSGSPVIPV